MCVHDLRYPLASGVTQKAVAERLDRVKGFLPEGPKFWNWLATRKGRGGKAGGGIMLDTQMEGATVLGSLGIEGQDAARDRQLGRARGQGPDVDRCGRPGIC